MIDFPRLEWNEFFQFPPPQEADSEGILAVGGNLSPGMLLSAYQQGCFPWYSEESPILWWNPDPRFVLYPQDFHVGDTLKKVLKKNPFRVSFDTCFEQVIRSCQKSPRPGQNGTWITEAVVQGYSELHTLGFAHSVEVWGQNTDDSGEALVGGLYGILIGRVFYGESMFSKASNASKVGFCTVFEYLKNKFDVALIDCQAPTKYLESFGAKSISREIFLDHLKTLAVFPVHRGSWNLS